MNRAIALYVDRAVLYAARLETLLNQGQGADPRCRAQMMADCAELHEISARLYQMLYHLKPELPDAADPVTLRFREYGEITGSPAPTAAVPSERQGGDAAKPKGQAEST